MIKKTIKYTDHNGKELTEDFYFHISKGEAVLMEMEAVDSQVEGLTDKIERLMRSREGKEIVAVFKDIVNKSYGIKTADGRFLKEDAQGNPLVVHFRSTEAYSELVFEMATNAEEGAKFINGMMPASFREDVKKEVERLAPRDHMQKETSSTQVVPDPVLPSPVQPEEDLTKLSHEELLARLQAK